MSLGLISGGHWFRRVESKWVQIHLVRKVHMEPQKKARKTPKKVMQKLVECFLELE